MVPRVAFRLHLPRHVGVRLKSPPDGHEDGHHHDERPHVLRVALTGDVGTHLLMALSEDDLRKVELHAEHALRAGEVLGKVRDLHVENIELRSRLERQAAQVAELVHVVGQAGQILRSVDGIYKNPAATVQTNFEDFLQPELRQLYGRFMRGVL